MCTVKIANIFMYYLEAPGCGGRRATVQVVILDAALSGHIPRHQS